MKNLFASLLGVALLYSTVSFALINGTTPSDADLVPFKNTFALRVKGAPTIYPFCTSARIGSRTLLVAAHCVFDSDTRAMRFAKNTAIQWTNVANPQVDLLDPNASWNDAVIEDAYVNDKVWEECRVPGCANIWEKAPDVGVIRLKDAPMLAFSPAYVDFTYVGSGNAIVIGGYGCEARYGANQHPAGNARLKWSNTVAVGNDLFSWVPFFRPSEDNQFFAAGETIVPGAATTCPGDSGGPVYRDDGAKNNIVGVNSRGSYDALTGAGQVSYFARVESLRDWIGKVTL